MISKFKNTKVHKGFTLFVSISLLLIVGVLFLKPVLTQSEQNAQQSFQLGSVVAKNIKNNDFSTNLTEEI